MVNNPNPPKSEGIIRPADFEPSLQLAPKVRYAEVQTRPAPRSEHQSLPELPGLLDYWHILRRQRGTIVLLLLLLGAIAGILSTFAQIPIYQARATIEVQSRYEMAKQSPPEALSDVLNDVILREYQVQIKALRRQKAELGTTFAPQSGPLRKVEAQIASLEGALERERSAIISRIGNEYEKAQRREMLLLADQTEQSQVVNEQSAKLIQYNILNRELESSRQLYESTLQRLKEAGVAAAMRASNIRVVDSAKPPRLPYKPSMGSNTTLGLSRGAFPRSGGRDGPRDGGPQSEGTR